jgi:hypothetical protein
MFTFAAPGWMRIATSGCEQRPRHLRPRRCRLPHLRQSGGCTDAGLPHRASARPHRRGESHEYERAPEGRTTATGHGASRQGGPMSRIDVTEKIIATKVAKGLVVPYKGSLPTTVPVDPLIYRFYELVNVYGTTERGQR